MNCHLKLDLKQIWFMLRMCLWMCVKYCRFPKIENLCKRWSIFTLFQFIDNLCFCLNTLQFLFAYRRLFTHKTHLHKWMLEWIFHLCKQLQHINKILIQHSWSWTNQHFYYCCLLLLCHVTIWVFAPGLSNRTATKLLICNFSLHNKKEYSYYLKLLVVALIHIRNVNIYI